MTIDTGRVAAAPLSPLAGQGWRHLAPSYDPLSGEGGAGEILAVFVQQIGHGRLEPHLAEEWHTLDQIDH